MLMLYNRWSYRKRPGPRKSTALSETSGIAGTGDVCAFMYDANSEGEAAPHTDYVSKPGVRWLLRDFSKVKIDVQNFDHLCRSSGGASKRDREQLLNNVGTCARP